MGERHAGPLWEGAQLATNDDAIALVDRVAWIASFAPSHNAGAALIARLHTENCGRERSSRRGR
ncbi:MAG: hypothetical protein K0R45_1632, partial [Pseudomonas sp.]|nr:hypothetical protein [Pseudomonas sp.]